MVEETAEAFEIYCTQIKCWLANRYGLDDQLERFRESYKGCYGGPAKGAKVKCLSIHRGDRNTSDAPLIWKGFFDYESFAMDLYLESYSEHKGHIYLPVNIKPDGV